MTETAARTIHTSLIHPSFGLILAVLLTMFGPVGIYVGIILGWIFTFSWLSTGKSTQKHHIFKRFMLTAVVPGFVWIGFGYLAFKVTPQYPSTDEIAEKVITGVANLPSKPTGTNKPEEKRTPSEEPRLKERLETKVLRNGEPEQEQTTLKPSEQPTLENKNEKSIEAKPKKDVSALSVELAPRVIHHVLRYKTGVDTGRQNEYGFAAIVRVRNDGKSLQQIKSLEFTEDVDAGSSYEHAFGLGKTSEEIDIEYAKRKPYLRLSFVAYPININKIEAAGEEFIRFMILDPPKLGTQGITRAAEVEKYIGFKGETAAQPKLLQTVPSISFFAKPTGFQHVRPGNARWTGVEARDEIKSGDLRFTLQFNSGPRIVIPSKITNQRLIGLENWNKQTPQDIFFDIDRRFIPLEKDPLVVRP